MTVKVYLYSEIHCLNSINSLFSMGILHILILQDQVDY